MADSIMQEMNTNEKRARLIAQQETMTSLSTGQYDMMVNAGAQTKTWHHMSITPDYRRDHRRMDGPYPSTRNSPTAYGSPETRTARRTKL